MNGQKGIVLETCKNKVIVLTPDGQFLEQKISGHMPQIGSEINLVSSSQANRRNWITLGIAAILIVTLIPLLALQLFIYPQIPVAYVTVDINPSIEMELNKYDKVISCKGLNQDGIILLNNVKLNNLAVEKALEIITEKAIEEKYIHPDKENAVIVSYAKDKTDKKVATKISTSNGEPSLEFSKEENLESMVKEVIERNQQQAIVEIVHVSPKVRNEAGELGLSTGKYTLMLEAWDEGLDISLDSIKGNNIINAIKEEGINPGEFISQLQKKNHNAKELEELTFKFEAEISKLRDLRNSELKKLTEQTLTQNSSRNGGADLQEGNENGKGNRAKLSIDWKNAGDVKSGDLPNDNQDKEKGFNALQKDIFNNKFKNMQDDKFSLKDKFKDTSLEKKEAKEIDKETDEREIARDKDKDKDKDKDENEDKDKDKDKDEDEDRDKDRDNDNNNKYKDKDKDKANYKRNDKDVNGNKHEDQSNNQGNGKNNQQIDENIDKDEAKEEDKEKGKNLGKGISKSKNNNDNNTPNEKSKNVINKEDKVTENPNKENRGPNKEEAEDQYNKENNEKNQENFSQKYKDSNYDKLPEKIKIMLQDIFDTKYR